MYLKYTKLERRPHAQINRVRYRIMGDKGRLTPPPHPWCATRRQNVRSEEIGRRIAGDAFVKLDFQTDLELIAPLFDCPTDDVDTIVARISDYKRAPIRKETTFILFDEVQLCERALNSLRFFSGSGWRICATGSQLGVATRKRKLPFPSGVRQETMHPMSFEEFLWALDEEQMADAIRTHAGTLETYAAHQAALSLFHRYQIVGACPPPSTHIARRYPSRMRASSSAKSTRPIPPI